MKFDLIIGIDLGMSGTAVAYHQPKGSLVPTKTENVTYLRWGTGDAIEKVPTKLAYKQDGRQKELIGWGTDIPMDNEAILIQEWFKTKLGDPEADQAQVEKLFLDYLSQLHAELARRFTPDELCEKPWAEANIAFYFSTPSIWDTAVVGRFKALVETAGFGQAQTAVHGPGVRTVDVSLVEPQATAALHLCSQDEAVKFKVKSPISAHQVFADDCCLERTVCHGRRRWRRHRGTPSPPTATGSLADWSQDFSLLRISNDKLGASRLDENSPVHGRWALASGGDSGN
ncbi:hypothetical protein LCI18_008342 [Fusarium solani-melongenae]|uniref:Uncharacterized protein n=1 Tax=Fusarium solani subsp. cucurbitae TaxID=2747967 RepID=A0ACD3Z8F3_FUSSC|nr:hypothetical protein LCI18_008342 [Fusarium solani-melongenae]